MENGINKNTRTRVLLFIPFFIILTRTHSNYRNNQARWRLGNAEMSIVVTSNNGKKNTSRLGKITSVDFNYKTCLVRVPNALYRCAVWKFSKKAGFAKVCSAETLTGTGYTKHQVYRLNVASKRQPATFNVIELKLKEYLPPPPLNKSEKMETYVHLARVRRLTISPVVVCRFDLTPIKSGCVYGIPSVA